MLAGIYYGAQYGGSTTAILVNIPGEATSVVTALDGHQMARQGRAGVALGIAAIGSFFAGTVATLIIAALGAPLTKLALLFGPADYFALMVLRADAGGGARARLAPQGHRHDPRRHPALHGRPRPGDRRGAADLRLDGDRRRHRVRGIGMGVFGFAEILRNLEQPEARDVVQRAPSAALLPTADDLRQSRQADPARHRPGLLARDPARQRRRARPLRVLYAREEARR